MAFTVEDGTGVVGANSYSSIAFADAYFADRDNEVWAAIPSDDLKEGYLIRATDYIENFFGRRFVGEMIATDQALSWPRKCADPPYPDDVIPLRLQKACAEYALRAIDGPLAPDPTVDATGFSVVIKKKVVGPIEKDFMVQGTSSRPSLVRSYPEADALMVPLLRPGTGGTRVIR
jgi:hypothetical protein